MSSDARQFSADTAAGRSPAALAVAGLVALAVAMGVGRFAFTPVLPMMIDDGSLTVVAGGWLASANYLGYLLGALSAMALRLQPEVLIRAALLVVSAVTLGMAFDDRLAVWIALRLLAGVASAWVLVFVSAWSLATLGPLQRPLLVSTVFAGVGTGIALAGVICLVLVRLHTGSAQAWLALGLLSLVASVAIWRCFTATKAAQPAPMKDPAAATAPRGIRKFISLVLCYGAFGFGYIIPATFLPLMARQQIQDPALFGWSWPIFGTAALLSTLAAGSLARRFGNRRVWSASHIVMALGVALPAAASGLAAITLAALFVGGTFMVITMVGMQEARRVAGPSAALLIAAMTSAFAAGQIAGPIVASMVVSVAGDFRAALVAAGVLLAVTAVILEKSAST